MKTEKQKVTSQIRGLMYYLINQSRKLKDITGYSMEELREHLSKQFKDGMTWNNYGEWEIDHIISISKFNYTSIKDKSFKKCWSLKNLQPLWKDKHAKKSSESYGKSSVVKTKIMKAWDSGQNVSQISKNMHMGLRTVRQIIKKQIGNDAYKKRCQNNLKKAWQKRIIN